MLAETIPIIICEISRYVHSPQNKSIKICDGFN